MCWTKVGAGQGLLCAQRCCLRCHEPKCEHNFSSRARIRLTKVLPDTLGSYEARLVVGLLVVHEIKCWIIEKGKRHVKDAAKRERKGKSKAQFLSQSPYRAFLVTQWPISNIFSYGYNMHALTWMEPERKHIRCRVQVKWNAIILTCRVRTLQGPPT